MPFLSKAQIQAEAERLGVDLDGLTWPQQQKAVIAAQMAEGGQARHEPRDPDAVLAELDWQPPTPRQQIEDRLEEHVPVPQEPVRVERGLNVPEQGIEQYKGKTVLLSPEMAQTKIQLLGYEEDLGEEVSVEEKSFKTQFEMGGSIPAEKDLYTGTYRVTGKTGRHTVAHSGLPKENAGIVFRPDMDMFPVVTFRGQYGYLWTHQRFPNVKDALMQSGYYEQFKGRFLDVAGAMFMLTGLTCVRVGLTHAVMAEIEELEAKKRKAGI